MEVHAHTHTPGKKWTHYLWEFLMLFLAVTLGFFVENWREHYIEGKREKQFIITMVEDLKSDTAQLNENILVGKSHEIMLDSLMLLLSLPNYSNYGAEIYYYARNVTRPIYFFPNDRTILQLKNSGSLRLIRNISASNSIMFYDQQVRYLAYLFNDENDVRSSFREKAGKIFDSRIFNTMFDSVGLIRYKKPIGNPGLTSQNKEYINEVISSTQYLKGPLRAIRMRQDKLKIIAINLILFLQKEYHLK